MTASVLFFLFASLSLSLSLSLTYSCCCWFPCYNVHFSAVKVLVMLQFNSVWLTGSKSEATLLLYLQPAAWLKYLGQSGSTQRSIHHSACKLLQRWNLCIFDHEARTFSYFVCVFIWIHYNFCMFSLCFVLISTCTEASTACLKAVTNGCLSKKTLKKPVRVRTLSLYLSHWYISMRFGTCVVQSK